MRVRGSDECSAGMKELLFVSKSCRLMKKVIGAGKEILEMLDRRVALICLERLDLISFN